MAIVSLPAPAGAQENCTPEYNVEAIKGVNSHRGVRVRSPGMWVEDASVSCARVSSIALIVDRDHLVELGWLDVNQANDPQGAPCPDFQVTQPRRFYFYVANGTAHCSFGGTWTSSEYHTFRIDNKDGDEVFDLYVDGAFWTSTVNTGFTIGRPITNGERDGNADRAYSDFNGLQFQDGSGWHDWVNTDPHADTDPDWNNFIQSCTHVLVRTADPVDGC